ncbi:UTP--glucose-1-phosphate uridylyltransferase [Georgenia alba]|uniref:UTP--glucose-1-phosphate uridylyltransferase n=1 Tax=Georgenia alba TaxID=2233858 RepID=A0ABW2Q2T1_9MICO
MSERGLELAREKMTAAGVATAAIETFSRFYGILESGATGLIREEDVDPLPELPRHADLDVSAAEAADALSRTAIIKLNGGLGTSMGMDRAKSLLPVRTGTGERDGEQLAFLDVIVGQIRAARAATGARLPLVLMNSFRTQDDTREALAPYGDLAVDGVPLDFLQNREPKLRADTLEPVEWPDDPDLEWCPPGHGDLYPALHASGVVKALLAAGFRYASVSNADNLGAGPDATIAAWFASTGAPYAAEMCLKTPADVKGGQLVVRKSDGRIIQRETAQTHPDDMEVSLDPARHRYFHTNNLWFDLEALDAELDRTGGVLELPLIRNEKTVDPTDSFSPKVVQIESAMGAAVAVFEGAQVIEVERERFLPVKTTNDLLVLRSDVYELTDDYRLRATVPAPLVRLSGAYKAISAFDARFPAGPPSLAGATSLTVDGDWTFGSGVAVEGEAALPDQGEPATVPDGATVTGEGVRV